MSYSVLRIQTFLSHQHKFHRQQVFRARVSFSFKRRYSDHIILNMVSRYQAKQQGGPFEIVSASKPAPAADEVLIKVKAVALNPIDAKQLCVVPLSCDTA